MYPSLKKDVMKDLVYRLVRDNGDLTQNINWKEMMIFLTKHMEITDLKVKGLGRLIPTKTTKDSYSFHYISVNEEIKPNQTQLNKIQGLVASQLISFIMDNHVYTVGDKMYKQSSGAPIGYDISRVLSRIAMIYFDDAFSKQIQENNMELQLHQRYMDDQNIAVDVDKDDEEDIHSLETKVANKVKTIADNIFPEMFTVTVDFPSNNPDNKMPILDLKVWIDPETNKIVHEHYRKPVSYRGIIWYNSGIPMSMKKNIILNEGLRRLSNCSPEMDMDSKLYWLSELNLFMLQAGYSIRFRKQMTNKILGIYLYKLSRHNQGIVNMYRKDCISKKSSHNKHNWYKKLGYKAAIQVPVTENQELAKQIKANLENYSGDKFLVQERLGRSIVSSLSTSNPNPSLTCHRNDCKVCISRPSKGLCYKPNVGYRIVCNRTPCNSRLDMKKLDNTGIKKL